MRRYVFKLNHSPSIWVAQALSILITIIISIGLLSAASLLLINDVLKETSMNYIIMMIHFIATFIGCIFSASISNGKILLHTSITALGYSLINVLTKMILEGQWRKQTFFIYTAILIGYVLSNLIMFNRISKKVKF